VILSALMQSFSKHIGLKPEAKKAEKKFDFLNNLFNI